MVPLYGFAVFVLAVLRERPSFDLPLCHALNLPIFPAGVGDRGLHLSFDGASAHLREESAGLRQSSARRTKSHLFLRRRTLGISI